MGAGMKSPALALARRTVRLLDPRIYPRHARASARISRLSDIESDLWESEHDPDRPARAMEMLARLLRGIPDDSSVEVRAGRRQRRARRHAGASRDDGISVYVFVRTSCFSSGGRDVVGLVARGPYSAARLGHARSRNRRFRTPRRHRSGRAAIRRGRRTRPIRKGDGDETKQHS